MFTLTGIPGMFSWLGSRHCVFPSVLPDYKPALPANVGWETFHFMHCSKLGPERRNCWFYQTLLVLSDVCDKEEMVAFCWVLPWDGCTEQPGSVWSALSALSQRPLKRKGKRCWERAEWGSSRAWDLQLQGMLSEGSGPAGAAQVLGCLGYLSIQFLQGSWVIMM